MKETAGIHTAAGAGRPGWIAPVIAGVAAAALAAGSVWGVGVWLRRQARPAWTSTASAVSADSAPPATTQTTTTAAETTTETATTTTRSRATSRTYPKVQAPVPVAPPSDPKQEQVERPDQSSEADHITLEQIRQELGGAGKILGVDVWRKTAADTPIDWQKVKAAGITFALIRVGGRSYGTDPENGGIYEDTKFDENIRGAIAAGIQVGVYFFSAAITETEALEEAQFVLDRIEPYREHITWPVAYDFEVFDIGRVKLCLEPPENPTEHQKELLATQGRVTSYTDVTDNAIAFMEYIIQAGYTPMLYTYRNTLWSRFETGRMGKYRIWMAQYVNELSSKRYGGPHAIWQCASNGQIDGITGPVDVNIAYDDLYRCAEPYVQEPEWPVTMEFERVEDTVAATSDHLGLRLSPDAALPNRYGTGRRGQRFRRTGINVENGWSRIVLRDSTVVYVSNDYLTDPIEEKPPESSGPSDKK